MNISKMIATLSVAVSMVATSALASPVAAVTEKVTSELVGTAIQRALTETAARTMTPAFEAAVVKAIGAELVKTGLTGTASTIAAKLAAEGTSLNQLNVLGSVGISEEAIVAAVNAVNYQTVLASIDTTGVYANATSGVETLAANTANTANAEQVGVIKAQLAAGTDVLGNASSDRDREILELLLQAVAENVSANTLTLTDGVEFLGNVAAIEAVADVFAAGIARCEKGEGYSVQAVANMREMVRTIAESGEIVSGMSAAELAGIVGVNLADAVGIEGSALDRVALLSAGAQGAGCDLFTGEIGAAAASL